MSNPIFPLTFTFAVTVTSAGGVVVSPAAVRQPTLRDGPDNGSPEATARRRGRPTSRVRAECVNVLFTAGHPMGAGEIHRLINSRTPTNASTVKKALVFLSRNGTIRYTSNGKFEVPGE